MSLFLTLVACSGCRPDLPSDHDSSRSTDSPADSSPPDSEDSGTPALCDLPEQEPNDYASMIDLPLERWACGTFDDVNDAEWFQITTAEDGWLMIDVEASSRGSSADVQIDIVQPDSGEVVHKNDGYLTTDPLLVFPTAPSTFQFALGENGHLYGEDYRWFVLAAQTKWPFDDIRQEDVVDEREPNDDAATAESEAGQVFPLGSPVFGRIDAPGDDDWFHVVVPEKTSALIFEVRAFKYGSAADIQISLWEPGATASLWEQSSGEIAYDPDPYAEYKVTPGAEFDLRVFRAGQDLGGIYHWYLINVTAVPNSEETP